MKSSNQINVSNYKSGRGFIGHYQKLIKRAVLPYQYDVLRDKAPGTEKSHVIANFVNAGKALEGKDAGDGFYGMVFQDSDAGKWIEAAAYSLVNFKDKALENAVDKVIDYIAKAQDSDGYLNTYFTIKDREKRWTNLLEAHELYCAGHLMEGACAYYEATGKDKFLKVMEKNAEHIYKRFITDKVPGYPGHPEVELALMKMYRTTGNKHCLELAEHFINVRGVDADYYKKEKEKRDWTVWGNNAEDNYYQQNYKPVREQDKATGHAVRAVYLYTGMADMAGQTGDAELIEACKRLWDSITKKQMYITGGIGSTVIGEAFSVDYDLPNDTAYCETCASIGLMFFASRMLEIDNNSEYADVMERAFYNTALAGMQLDGKSFFYVNPLECQPGISGKTGTHRHTLTSRPRWYACACCPPNLARTISSFGKYAYSDNEKTAYCHLYAEGVATFKNGLKLECATTYPDNLSVKYTVLAGSGELAVRLPGWSKANVVTVNGKEVATKVVKEYAFFDVSQGDVIELIFDKSPRKIYASSKVPALSGKLAIERGPLVYCFEGVDNGGEVFNLTIPKNVKINVERGRDKTLGGIKGLMVDAFKVEAKTGDGLYSAEAPVITKCKARAIPYYAWCNRGENQMRVWMPWS